LEKTERSHAKKVNTAGGSTREEKMNPLARLRKLTAKKTEREHTTLRGRATGA